MERYFTLIMPDQIRRMKRPEFGSHGRLTIREYRKELQRFQPWFEEYSRFGTIREFADLDKHKDRFLDPDPEVRRVESMKWMRRDHFECCFLEKACITVMKHKDGTYSVLTNGRHRLYAAKRFRLPVLVCVAEEEGV